MNNFFNTIKRSYSAEEDNIGDDFLKPCLENCYSYDRWGSYFTSNSIDTFKEIIPNIIFEKKIKMRFVLTPQLEEKDYEILKIISDPEKRKKYLSENCEKIIDEVLEYAKGQGSSEKRLKVFFWLLDQSIIEIKFAFMSNNKGIFHSKIGIFKFENGNQIAFTGSMNESKQAHMDNFDEIDVFRSWYDVNDKDRVNEKVNRFENSWNNSMKTLEVFELSENTLSKIRTYSHSIESEIKDIIKPNQTDDIYQKLWPHQQKALDEFVIKKKGVLELATGTGKTFTSLAIFKKLYDAKSVNSLIVFTKDSALLKQWYKELGDFNNKYFDGSLKIFRDYSSYKEINAYLFHQKNSIIIIRLQNLYLLLRNHLFDKNQKLLIGDEIHDFGSFTIQNRLSDKIKYIEYTLGLSATPERKYDDIGTQFIFDEIGPVLENCKFTLRDAIQNNILCRFKYNTIPYVLTETEKELRQKYISTKEKLISNAKAKYSKNPKKLRTLIKDIEERFAREISNIYKSAENKLINLKEFVAKNPEVVKQTFLFAYPHEYAQRVSKIVQDYTRDYEYLRDNLEDKQLKNFASGQISFIIAVKKLSQGVDFKNLNNIIMMYSQSSDLMTIQRIGRCLRKNPNDPNKIAWIVDFINDEYDTDVKRKKMIENILI